MREYPKTTEEALRTTYGANHKRPWNPERCAAEVADTSNSRWTYWRQCSNKPGYGPSTLYCKRHAPLADPDNVKTFTIWVVDHFFDVRVVEAQAHKETVTMFKLPNGGVEQKTSKDSHAFRDRDKAYDFAIALLDSRVTGALKKAETNRKRKSELLAEREKQPDTNPTNPDQLTA